MQCYTELIPPSGVTQALSLPFTSANASNLIIARTSLLQIFHCKSINQAQDTKLVLVAEYNLAGTVTSLGRVKVSNSKGGGDAILVALRNAKLSLIEWDPTQHAISTISIHYYEHHELQAAPWAPDLRSSISHLTVDPSSRCAAYNFGLSNLAIIPFRAKSDDLVMDDLDDEIEDQSNGTQTVEDINGEALPSLPSYVLPLTVLDPGLLNPIDMAFLYEYRDPTIGILYSGVARSANMSVERKDVTAYAVYAFDLDQKASTTLLSVTKLPNDLHQLVALPLPVGGALLVGGNELIHIDQGGRSNALGVNEFARESTSFPMSDHAEYQLRLEGCRVEQIGNATGDILIILASSEALVLSFRIDGRSVSGMSLQRIESELVSNIIKSSSSCMATVGNGCVFVGSEEGDSVLIATSKNSVQLKRQNSRLQSISKSGANDEESDEDDDFGDDDDLYGDNPMNGMNGTTTELSSVTGNVFRLLDRLQCIAPLHDMAFGRPSKRKREVQKDEADDIDADKLQLVASCGRGRAGGLAFFSKQISPRTIKRTKYENAAGIWCFDAGEAEDEVPPAEARIYSGKHVILSSIDAHGSGSSSLLTINDMELQSRQGTEFDELAGPTIAVGRLTTTKKLIQVTPTEIRVYDSGFRLSQIFPIVDEEEDQLARVKQANFLEPYLVIVKDDQSMSILKADRTGELDEVELPDFLKQNSIVNVNVYEDTADFFQTSRYYNNTDHEFKKLILSILTSDGSFFMLSLPNFSFRVFECEGLHFLPKLLAQDSQIPKHWRSKDEISEMLLADLGDEFDRKPYLIIRNTIQDLVIYQPFAIPEIVGTYKFIKIATKNAIMAVSDINESLLNQPYQTSQVLRTNAGNSSIFIPGSCPRLVVKKASSMPQVYNIGHMKIKSVSGIAEGPEGMAILFIDEDEHVCTAIIPSITSICNSDWVIEKVELGQDVTSIAYYQPSQSYVASTNYPAQFRLPQDDEWHPEWQGEDVGFPPMTMQSSLILISSETHSILSQYHFETAERVLCIKCCNLEISEETHERKDLIVVGTGIAKGENIVTRGNIYIFDVVDVVPYPEVPETNLKLKLITREDVRGAVTAISEVGSQGFVLAVQGQKCMVRGLKEDNTLLPVAFLDLRYYVKVVKSLKGTGLSILGDGFSGMWLTGYSEEPYKMQLLGYDLSNPEVLAGEFLPDKKQLFIVISDGDGQIRVLQYDPENPKTERGIKLLVRSTFNTGVFPTEMTLLPQSKSTQNSDDKMDLEYFSSSNINSSQSQILVITQEGAVALITPVSDQTYRRLSTLLNIFITNLEHPCSLNPRAYRQIETDGIGGRGMIDGNLVKRWLDQSSQHKASTADKVGGTVWDVRSDLEIIGGVGLASLI